MIKVLDYLYLLSLIIYFLEFSFVMELLDSTITRNNKFIPQNDKIIFKIYSNK
jgi:hypothetical protein